MTLSTPRDLDELPDGTEIELLDKRGTRRVKVGGHWRWPDAGKADTSTWNVNTYVNARRYGARVITEEDVQVSLAEGIKKIVAEYDELQKLREEELAEFKDEEGEVVDWYSYDSRRTEQDEADAEQYGFVISRLAKLVEEAGE